MTVTEEHNRDALADTGWQRVVLPQFIPPGLTRRLTTSEAGVVTEDGQVRLDEDTDPLGALAEPDTIPPGTEVRVALRSGQVEARPAVAVEAARRDRQHERALAERAQRRARFHAAARARHEARQFWADYRIPFAYATAIKGQRNELLRGSTGTGVDDRTVIHLFVREMFTTPDGRLSRSADSYLCSDDADLRYTPVTGEGPSVPTHPDFPSADDLEPPVTCATCLKRMDRWERKEA